MSVNFDVALSNIMEIYTDAESFTKVEALKQVYNYTKIVMKGQGSFLKRLEAEIYDESLCIGLCPLCQTVLNEESDDEDRGEFMGTPTKEKVYTRHCESCGWDDSGRY